MKLNGYRIHCSAERESFTLQRERVALGGRGVKRLGGFFDLFVGRRVGEPVLARRQRVVGDAWPGARDRLVDRLSIGPGADLFAILRHGCLRHRNTWCSSASPLTKVPSLRPANRTRRTGRGPIAG